MPGEGKVFDLMGQVAMGILACGKFTWSGGGASVAHTVSGVRDSDVVIAEILSAPSEAGYVASAVPTADTVTITLSAANTSNDAVIRYIVFRPINF